jgi:hypothetical protein
MVPIPELRHNGLTGRRKAKEELMGRFAIFSAKQLGGNWIVSGDIDLKVGLAARTLQRHAEVRLD